MAAAAYEYRYSFSVDEEMIRRYDGNSSDWLGNLMFETRIKFIVEGNSGERVIIDSESFAVGGVGIFSENEEYLQRRIGRRLNDIWMPRPQIRTMIHQFLLFAKQIRASGRRGKIPAAVDLEVCTVQREGEAMASAVERAMRPEYLPPLYLYPLDGIGNPSPLRSGDFNMSYLNVLPKIPVEDAEKALSFMELCDICGRKPVVGTQISSLPCAHAFHYHCIALRLLEESNSCPTCHHHPGFDPSPSFNSFCKYGYDINPQEELWPQLDDDDDDDEDDDDDHDSDLDDFF